MQSKDRGMNDTLREIKKKCQGSHRKTPPLHQKKTTISKISATPKIPPEVLSFMFAFLPITSIVRFSCACKYLNALIKSSSFVRRHLLLARVGLLLLFSFPNRERLFLNEENSTLSLLNLSLRKYVVLGSCNGLLCMRKKGHRKLYYICNPSIQKMKKLPLIDESCPKDCVLTTGIGFVPSTGEYKIVRIRSTEICRELCEVYTVDGRFDSWRQIDNLANFHNNGVLHPPICVSGILYWIASIKESRVFEVVMLDLKTEGLQSVSVPDQLSDKRIKVFTIEWNGELCVVQIWDSNFVLWVLKENHEWRCMADTSLTFLLECNYYEEAEHHIRPLAMRNGGEFIFLFKSSFIYSYNLWNGSLKKIYESHVPIVGGIYNHVNSLIWFD